MRSKLSFVKEGKYGKGIRDLLFTQRQYKKIAESVLEKLKQKGVEAVIKNVKKVKVEELLEYGAITIGSPIYYGFMTV